MSIIAHTVGYADGENGQVFPITDRRIYDEIASGKSGIVKGCELTYVSNNTVHISSGWGVISGCIFTVEDEDISVQLAPSGELAGWLFARVSTNASSAEFVSNVGVEYDPADLMNDDLTVTDGVHDLILATYTVSTTGLSDFADVAPKINLGEDLSGIVGGDAWTQRTYVAGEFCIYNNKAWECVADTTNEPSESDSSHWKLISLKLLTNRTTWKLCPANGDGSYRIPDGTTELCFQLYDSTNLLHQSVYIVPIIASRQTGRVDYMYGLTRIVINNNAAWCSEFYYGNSIVQNKVALIYYR